MARLRGRAAKAGDVWTVPLGGGVGKLFRLGQVLPLEGHAITKLPSPTRAALITGRNHHSVGFGVISEASTGFPGYNSIIPKD